jgi:dienelactone hydrolase
MARLFLFVLFLITVVSSISIAETVQFKATDGVLITAETGGKARGPVIILFHMAGASRGEYRDIAPRLHTLGYRTLAVDQRSGGGFNGVRNETVAGVGRSAGYAAAIPDLKAAGIYARHVMKAKRVGVIGSSYSASLVLIVAGNDAGFADAVMSFSPGEYFSDGRHVRTAATKIKAPVFLTAARGEIGQITPIAKVITSPVTVFKPKGSGRHGATALATKSKAEYWAALEAFLAKHFPAR